MSKKCALSLRSIAKRGGRGFLFALIVLMCAMQPVESAAADNPEAGGNAAMQLAAKIAGADAGRVQNKTELLADYEKVYGKIDNVPTRWPVLVRRALICRQVSDQACLRSSIEAIDKIGGVNTFPLNHLFEVSRFGMSPETIRGHLRDTETSSVNTEKPASKPGLERPASTPASAPLAAPTLVAARQSAPDIPAKPISAKAAAPVAAAAGVSVKNPGSRTILQRISARLGKLGATDAAGFFLDALFVLVAISLLFAYFLFSAIRGRRAERRERLLALQEILRLEELRAEEKLRTDHELRSEKLKSEVALEAQRTHSDKLIRMAQHAAEEAIKAGELRAEEMIRLEQSRAAEAIKMEQEKTEEAIKAAKYRADQAIDAYDQMAARELVFAHQHNDELQEVLSAEQERRAAQELKTEEALQAVEAFKAKEKKLMEIIRAEQRVRASEARLAAEKLKAAQQAAAALQASLVATRALKADLERRADEAMHAAELRVAEARQRYEGRALPGGPSAQTMAESSGQIRPPETETTSTGSVMLNDAHSG